MATNGQEVDKAREPYGDFPQLFLHFLLFGWGKGKRVERKVGWKIFFLIYRKKSI